MMWLSFSAKLCSARCINKQRERTGGGVGEKQHSRGYLCGLASELDFRSLLLPKKSLSVFPSSDVILSLLLLILLSSVRCAGREHDGPSEPSEE